MKIGDEIVGDVDLGERFRFGAAAMPEFFDGFLGSVLLAINLPVEAAEPLELSLGLADLLRRICLRRLGLDGRAGRGRQRRLHFRRRNFRRQSGNALLLFQSLLLVLSGNALLFVLGLLLFEGGNALLLFQSLLLVLSGNALLFV